ncbi:MAG: CoA transferase [Deltaproteobacteria bacterium]|nr:CoA transferase [Deltaproteobacteria bacterium]
MTIRPLPTEPLRRVVLSMEQALSLPYATERMVQLGWRVIRLEPTPIPGRKAKGDPNRYVGKPVAGEDRASYFVAPNCGKEAIAVDLKSEAGRELLAQLIRGLDVEIFCTNTMPARHAGLGLDYEALRAVREDLIWCSISAMGLAYPEVPGYDPVMQALCGYMDLTGEADGPPMQAGVPLVDLKAGDEAFTQVLAALLDRAEGRGGRAIDISMAQVALSWLPTVLPLLDLGSSADELRRAGNEHRQFVPVNAYPTADGFIYLALGSDAQWARLVLEPIFASLADPGYATNAGRKARRADLHGAIARLTASQSTAAVAAALVRAEVPNAPISTLDELTSLPFVREALLRTKTPDGRTVRLPPPAVGTAHLASLGGELPFAPAYGAHTQSVLEEAGLSAAEIATLRAQGVVA